MDVKDAIRRRRTIRQFKQEKVGKESIMKLIDAARFAPCGGNMQKLRFMVIEKEETVKKIFEQTVWGGHVKPRRNPEWGVSAPLSFILVTSPVNAGQVAVADAGAAIENMLLQAVGMGLGCCWIGAFKVDNVAEILQLSKDLKPVFLLAIGVPAESPLQEDIKEGDDVKYYLDDNNCLHVPKYTVDSITTWI